MCHKYLYVSYGQSSIAPNPGNFEGCEAIVPFLNHSNCQNGQKRPLWTMYTWEAHFFSEGLPSYNIYMCFSVPNKIVLTFWARSERHPVGLALDKTWKLAVSTAEHFTKGNLICISWNLNLDFSKFSTRFCCINHKPRFPHFSMQGYQDLNFCDLIPASMYVVRHVKHIIGILGQQLKDRS